MERFFAVKIRKRLHYIGSSPKAVDDIS